MRDSEQAGRRPASSGFISFLDADASPIEPSGALTVAIREFK